MIATYTVYVTDNGKIWSNETHYGEDLSDAIRAIREWDWEIVWVWKTTYDETTSAMTAEDVSVKAAEALIDYYEDDATHPPTHVLNFIELHHPNWVPPEDLS